ncbi:MAG: DUF4215 domain-containing protein, partial [Myxococcota bacterium]|nr:DUF4215 domain-containing protein [Myxococcota bacterium]
VEPNRCGNGIEEAGEGCDDGNLDVDDGCSNRCLVEVPPNEGDVRIVGSERPTFGRVQIFLEGRWGYICDDGWDISDADVLCRQAGYAGAVRPLSSFGGGDGAYILSDIECRGDEVRLTDCAYPDVGVNVCFEGEEAGVECFEDGGCRISSQCADGEVCAPGNVCAPAGICGNEVIEDGEACDDGNQLDGDGCSTTCAREEGVPLEGDLRLVGGRSTGGRLEVFRGEQWSNVCDEGWDELDAQVACRQLGFARAYVALDRQQLDDVGLDDLQRQCIGDESRLELCPAVSTEACMGDRGAGVVCLVEGQCAESAECDVGAVCNLDFECVSAGLCGNGIREGREGCDDGNVVSGDGCAENCSRELGATLNGDVRLAGGVDNRSGRVEVYWQGTWKGVCDDGWGLEDADIVCQQLGFARAEAALAEHDGGRVEFLLDDVGCQGDERWLLACPNAGLFVNNCGLGEEATAICADGPQCVRSADCRAGEYCREGVCLLEENGRCARDEDCAPGFICGDEFCVEEPRCVERPYQVGTVEQGTTADGSVLHQAECQETQGPEIAFTFVSPATSPICFSTAGSEIDTVLTVHTDGCTGPTLACNDNAQLAGGFNSALEFDAVQGVEYTVVVDGFRLNQGAFRLSSRVGPCDEERPPPVCVRDRDCPLGEGCRDDVCKVVAEPPMVGQVVFSEVMYDLAAGLEDGRGEWIELYNNSWIRRRLDGCKLFDSDRLAFPDSGVDLDGLIVPPQGRIVLGRIDDPVQNGGIDVDGTFDFRLNNGGDVLVLRCGETDIDRVEFNDQNRFPPAEGTTIQRSENQLNGVDGPDQIWCLATTPYLEFPQQLGTPGTENRICPRADPTGSCLEPDVVVMGAIYEGTTAGRADRQSAACVGEQGGLDVVHVLETPRAGPVCISTRGSDFRTALEVRLVCDRQVEIDCQVSEDAETGSTIEFNALARGQYYILVDGENAEAQGNYQLTVTEGPCPRECTAAEDCLDGEICLEGVCRECQDDRCPFGVIHVSTTGDDLDNDGTLALPFRTIQAGIDAAQMQGISQVRVASGLYRTSFALANGVHVTGGYDPNRGWERQTAQPTVVVADSPVMFAENILAPTTVRGLVLRALDTDEENEALMGGASIAVLAINSDGLSLEDSQMIAGRGADGSDGADGVPGAAGAMGQAGLDGRFDGGMCRDGDGGDGGRAQCGDADVSGGTGGPGGRSGRGDGAGFNGSNGRGQRAGGGGQGSAVGPACQPANDGLDGQPGGQGTAGRDGLVNEGIGDVVDGVWRAAHGADGRVGLPGSGGGGGGGVGGSQDDDRTCRFDCGSGGGGGGAGGCGGVGGDGGRGGGASIAVVLVNSSGTIKNCTIRSGAGGAGGRGGKGGAGGIGGIGGIGGGENALSDKLGGRGGLGGIGGRGGHGAGGNGGVSFGVVRLEGSMPLLIDNGFNIGRGGLGGASFGTAGLDGAQGEVY